MGTSFNVNAYADSPVHTTTLVSGKIKYMAQEIQREVVLCPDQQVSLDCEAGGVNVSEVNAALYSVWKEGWIWFENERLENLVQRLAHLPGVVEVDGQPAQVEALEDREQSAEGGGEGVADVHQVARHRHNHGGVEVGPLGGIAVGIVQLLELGLGLRLVGEGLYHLQSLDGLLDFPVDRPQGGLLPGVILPAAPAEHQEHRRHASQHH